MSLPGGTDHLAFDRRKLLLLSKGRAKIMTICENNSVRTHELGPMDYASSELLNVRLEKDQLIVPTGEDGTVAVLNYWYGTPRPTEAEGVVAATAYHRRLGRLILVAVALVRRALLQLLGWL